MHGTYEAHLAPETLARIWARLDTTLELDPKWTLYAAATFDHALLPGGINQWIQRRGTSFNLSVHSVVALLAAHVVGAVLDLKPARW